MAEAVQDESQNVQLSNGEGASSPTPEAPSSVQDKFGSKFAHLARKEKAIFARQRAIEEREKALETKLAEYESKYVPKESLSDNPIGTLLENGFSVEQIAGMLLNQNEASNPEIMNLRREIRLLSEATERSKKEAEESEKRKHEQAKASVAQSIRSLCKDNDEFETINFLEAHDSVVELMEKTLEEDGYLMNEDEAAKEVESYLRDKFYGFVNLKNVKARMNPEQESPGIPAGSETPGIPEKKQSTESNLEKLKGMTTLSNRQAATGAKPLTMKERLQRAYAIAEGKQL